MPILGRHNFDVLQKLASRRPHSPRTMIRYRRASLGGLIMGGSAAVIRCRDPGMALEGG
jgi:hypothetical protein